MEYSQKTSALSNYVDKEIMDVCDDDQFAFKSEQIFSMLSWMTEKEDYQEIDSLSQISVTSLEFWNIYDNESHNGTDVLAVNNVNDLVPLLVGKSQQENYNPVEHASLGELNHTFNNSSESRSLLHRDETVHSKQLSQKEEEVSSTSSKCKHVTPREVKPVNFTSLKRKDVIFKSILRMMRRYFWNLLENSTDYNRKEKCIYTKHKQLVKCLGEGMEKLGFNQVGPNMPFYFSAFAYPNDMKKILKESKQQFRTQNDLLWQATYIVNLVDNAFNRFSKKVFDDMLAIPQIDFLVQYYLDNANDLVKEPKVFEDCYSILAKKSRAFDELSSPNSEFDHNMNEMFKDFNTNANFLSKNIKADTGKLK